MFGKAMRETTDLNLLVVDDEHRIARMAKRSLGKKWKSVTLAYSADEGIEALKSGEFDVVLTDWDCPGEGSGYLVIQSTDLPAVVQTGTKGVTCPGVRVLNKPVSADVIYEALVEAYSKRRTR